MNNTKYSIEKLHKEFVPLYDRWEGKLLPRVQSWFLHIGEIICLYLKGNKAYYKHGRTLGTCREHAKTEFGDLLWLTAEIFWMITKIELPIVSNETYRRVWEKMNESKKKSSI